MSEKNRLNISLEVIPFYRTLCAKLDCELDIDYDGTDHFILYKGITKKKLKEEMDNMMKNIKETRISSFKEFKISQFKEFVNKIILDKWPYYKQLNCLNGIYEESMVNEMKKFIQNMIDKTNDFETTIKNLSIEEIKSLDFNDFI